MSRQFDYDASSVSNQPLLPKTSEPQARPDYETAAATLMVTYGFGGHTPQPAPSLKKKKDESKQEKAKGKKRLSWFRSSVKTEDAVRSESQPSEASHSPQSENH